MDTPRRSKKLRTSTGSCSRGANCGEWEPIYMSEEEEDLICRMYKLVGERWDLIAGRVPGRTPEQIERYWLMKHGHVSSSGI